MTNPDFVKKYEKTNHRYPSCPNPMNARAGWFLKGKQVLMFFEKERKKERDTKFLEASVFFSPPPKKNKKK
jgi:hypothetical protein